MRNDELLRLRNLDFNLLKTLLVLLEQRHISNTADILCISQPAVSKQLNRLRDMFDDPLLTRTGNQLLLTPKAVRLKPSVQNLCQQVSALVLPDTLNLNEVTANVSIMFSDYASPIWVNKLLHQISLEAPKVTITCKNWSEENIQKLYRGEINFSLGPMVGNSSLYESAHLGEHASALIARASHPLFSLPEEQMQDAFPAYPLVKMQGSKRYQEIYEQAYANQPTLINEVGLWLALETLKSTNAVMVGPQKFAQAIASNQEFDTAPLDRLPLIPITVCWTKGLTSDLFYQWLCHKIIAIGTQLLTD